MTVSCQVYNADGEFLFKFGSHGEGNGQFNAPTGVAVDANGNIIVADWGNSRIQVKTTLCWAKNLYNVSLRKAKKKTSAL